MNFSTPLGHCKHVLTLALILLTFRIGVLLTSSSAQVVQIHKQNVSMFFYGCISSLEKKLALAA
jgi:hypothetical protein